MHILLEAIKPKFSEWQIAYSHTPGNKEITMSKSWVIFVIKFGIP